MGQFSFSGNTGFSGSGSSSSWAGKTFTIGGSNNVSNASTGSKLSAAPDKIVKPGLSDEVLQRLALMRPPVVNGPADLRWGKPSKFQINAPSTASQITYLPGGGGVTVHLPPDDAPELVEYDEVHRQEEDVRVENPDDADQYVIVARMVNILFQNRETGFYMALNFRNPPRP